MIAFIPAYHIDRRGNRSASLQVITSKKSYKLFYPIEDFRVSRRRLAIRIGDNLFSDKRVSINIKAEGLTLYGKLYHLPFISLRRDIMGPFRYVPFLQCRHSIYSMAHGVRGSLTFDGIKKGFNQGIGYVEGDRGRGFPSEYLWTQCSWEDSFMNSLMASVANVKLAGYEFPGCICAIYYHGKQYRLATYQGAKISVYNRRELWINQGIYDLHVEILDRDENVLLAPVRGRMSRNVYESVNAKLHYQFYEDGNILFDITKKGCIERG